MQSTGTKIGICRLGGGSLLPPEADSGRSRSAGDLELAHGEHGSVMAQIARLRRSLQHLVRGWPGEVDTHGFLVA